MLLAVSVSLLPLLMPKYAGFELYICVRLLDNTCLLVAVTTVWSEGVVERIRANLLRFHSVTSHIVLP